MVDVKTEMAAELRRQILSAIAKGVIVLVTNNCGRCIDYNLYLARPIRPRANGYGRSLRQKGLSTGWEEYKRGLGTLHYRCSRRS